MDNKPCRGYTSGKDLGSGSYGTVQRVVSRSGHIYARKAQDEITLVEYQASKLNHPNVITCHDVQFDCDDSPVSVYLSPVGKSLEDILHKTALDYKTKLNYIGDIVDGLAHLHYNNILHLDMKPGNIIISDGRAVIIDFGLSVYGKSPLTMKNGGTRITSWFRNPAIDYEFMTTKKEVYSRKSDLYSLALIILLILVDGKFKTYQDMMTQQSYIDVKNVEGMLKAARIPDHDLWHQLIEKMLQSELDTFDLLSHPLLHYHTFQARKLGQIQYPIVNSNPSYIKNLILDALETIAEKRLGHLPYYVLAYFIKLCLLGPEVPSFEFIACMYYFGFDTENEQVTKYFHNKITLLESMEDCVNFHRLVIEGNYEQALEIEPKDVVLLATAPINEVLARYKM